MMRPITILTALLMMTSGLVVGGAVAQTGTALDPAIGAVSDAAGTFAGDAVTFAECTGGAMDPSGCTAPDHEAFLAAMQGAATAAAGQFTGFLCTDSTGDLVADCVEGVTNVAIEAATAAGRAASEACGDVDAEPEEQCVDLAMESAMFALGVATTALNAACEGGDGEQPTDTCVTFAQTEAADAAQQADSTLNEQCGGIDGQTAAESCPLFVVGSVEATEAALHAGCASFAAENGAEIEGCAGLADPAVLRLIAEANGVPITSLETTIAEALAFITAEDKDVFCSTNGDNQFCQQYLAALAAVPVSVEQNGDAQVITLAVPGTDALVITADPVAQSLEVRHGDQVLLPPEPGQGSTGEDIVIPFAYFRNHQSIEVLTYIRIDIDATPAEGSGCNDSMCQDNTIAERPGSLPSWARIRFDDDADMFDDEDGDGDIDDNEVYFAATGDGSGFGSSGAIHWEPFCVDPQDFVLNGCIGVGAVNPYTEDGRDTLTVSELHFKVPPNNDYARYYLWSDLDDDGDSDNSERDHPSNPFHPESTLDDRDGDLLSDAIEDIWGTDKADKDHDNDGVEDGIEDLNNDGILAPVPAGWTKADLDDQGIFALPAAHEPHLDSYENAFLETDPRVADTDGDVELDGRDIHPRHGRLEYAGLDADGLPVYMASGRGTHVGSIRDSDKDADGLYDTCELFYHGDLSILGTPFTGTPDVSDLDEDRLSDQRECDSWRRSDVPDHDNFVINIHGDSNRDENLRVSPTDPDTDRDGLQDGEELLGTLISVSGEAPYSDPDQDGDGDISTILSLLAGDVGGNSETHSQSQLAGDTDNDGLADGVEVFGDWNGDTIAARVSAWNAVHSGYAAWSAENAIGTTSTDPVTDGFTAPVQPDWVTINDGVWADVPAVLDADVRQLIGGTLGIGDRISINDAGTPDDDSDDYLEFDLEAMYPLSTKPIGDDLDGDGYVPGGELMGMVRMLEPFNGGADAGSGGRDSDDDGLTDLEELQGMWDSLMRYDAHGNSADDYHWSGYGFTPDEPDAVDRSFFPTDPTVVDTDDDGYTDGQEAKETGGVNAANGPRFCHDWETNSNGNAINRCNGGHRKDSGAEAILIDSDADGMSDYEEISENWLGYDRPDVPGDGAAYRSQSCGSNCATNYYTRAGLYDTDADGLGDGQEIKDTFGNTPDVDFFLPAGAAIAIGHTQTVGPDALRIDCGTGKHPRDLILAVDCDAGFGTRPHQDDRRGGAVSLDTDQDGIGDLEELLGGDFGGDHDGSYPRPTNPVIWDMDGDNMPDGREVNPAIRGSVTGKDWPATDPYNADEDGDGVNDQKEIEQSEGLACPFVAPFNGIVFTFNFGPLNDAVDCDGGWNTDPHHRDTDLDGLSDDYEIAQYDGDDDYPWSPTDADSDDDGLNDGREVKDKDDPLGCDDAFVTTELDDDCDGGHGTSVITPDTDEDGVLDGEEVDTWGSNPLSEHSDGDGIPDGDEVFGEFNGRYNGDATHPALDDTDGDGLSDTQEMIDTSGSADCLDLGLTQTRAFGDLGFCNGGYGTDPNDVDTDKDSFSDFIEVEAGSDPLDIGDLPDGDSDNDNLADLWEDLYFGNADGTPTAAELALYDAEDDPDGDGFDNEAEHAARDATLDYVAIDATNAPDADPDNADSTPLDRDGDGLFRADELEYFAGEYEYGAQDDPDADGLNNIEEIGRDDYDDDIVSYPNDPDSDDDGLSDGQEVNDIGSEPLEVDTDGDGLGDGQEVFGTANPFPAYSGSGPSAEAGPLEDGGATDPLSRDTDGDALTDGQEVTATPPLDPNNPDTDADAYTDGAEYLYYQQSSVEARDPDANPGTQLVETGSVPDPAQVLFNPDCDFTAPGAWEDGSWNSDECGDQDLVQESAEILAYAAGIVSTVNEIAGSLDPADGVGGVAEAADAALTLAFEQTGEVVGTAAGFTDQNDPRDLNGDNSRGGQPNGQIDIVERNIVYYNVDEAGDDEGDRFDGDDTGATVVIVDASSGDLFGSIPDGRLVTLRVGDVAGTEAEEVLVIEILGNSQSTGFSAICINQDGSVMEGPGFAANVGCTEVIVPATGELSAAIAAMVSDDDGDGIPAAADNCPEDTNALQADADQDGEGDACDSDIDGDGTPNGADAFPNDAEETADSDGDGVGDNSDVCPGHDDAADQDGDTVPDGCDDDADGDEVPKSNDLDDNDETVGHDDDGDGVQSLADNCPDTANADQADMDTDGKGDACDDDIDGDGFSNELETENGSDPEDAESTPLGVTADAVMTMVGETVVTVEEALASLDANDNGMPDALEPTFANSCHDYAGEPVYFCQYDGASNVQMIHEGWEGYYVIVFGVPVRV